MTELTMIQEAPHAVYAARFAGTADTYACTPRESSNNGHHSRNRDNRQRLWVLSVVGSQTGARAIRANFLKGEELVIAPVNEEGDTIYEHAARMIRAETESQWTWMEQKLPGSKALQTVVYPRIAELDYGMPEFLLLERSCDEPEPAEQAINHYRRLNRRVDLPLHRSWADWLWERALENREAKPIEGLGLCGWICKPEVDNLRDEISEAVRYGLLRVPEHDRT